MAVPLALFLFGISVLLMLATRLVAAQLDLVFSQNIFVQQPGDTFSVGVVVSNPFTNANTYTLDNYFLSIIPIGANPALNLRTDITKDPTGFFTTFARSYAPGESATGNIFDFALSNTAPAGDYKVNVSLRNPSDAPLGQSSFELQIQQNPPPIPELNSLLSLGAMMAAGGYSLWRQRQRQSTPHAKSQDRRI